MKINLNIGAMLKYVDRKMVAVMLVLAALAVILNVFVVSNAQTDLAGMQKDLADKQGSYQQLTTRLQDIRQSGVTDLKGLLTRISANEQALPKESDSLTATTMAALLAQQSGVTLGRFDPVELNGNKKTGKGLSQEDLTAGILGAHPYRFSITGSLDQVNEFLARVQADPKWLATVQGLTLTSRPTNTEAALLAAKGEKPSIFSTSTSADGVLFIWGLNPPPIVAGLKVDEAAGADAAGTGADGAATAPAASAAPQASTPAPVASTAPQASTPAPVASTAPASQPAASAAPKPSTAASTAPAPASPAPASAAPKPSTPASPVASAR